VEDFLARRIRLLFLHARAAMEAAPLVGDLMMQEMGKDEAWRKAQLDDFFALANKYVLS
jgi:glycerol-3-phosphate dehydrogenase